MHARTHTHTHTHTCMRAHTHTHTQPSSKNWHLLDDFHPVCLTHNHQKLTVNQKALYTLPGDAQQQRLERFPHRTHKGSCLHLANTDRYTHNEISSLNIYFFLWLDCERKVKPTKYCRFNHDQLPPPPPPHPPFPAPYTFLSSQSVQVPQMHWRNFA